MSVVSPPAITALPTPPDPNDRTTFNARAYPWSVAQQTFGVQVGAVAANVFANATDAAGSASAAASSAAAATTNGATQVALAAARAAAAAASAVDATNNGAAQVALATAQANISAASANYKGLWSSLTGALNMPASVSYNNVFWALNSNLANVTAATPGVSAAWTQISGSAIKRVARTSNTALTSIDASKIISMTGTWTQTFAAAAALGDGWFCYLRNDGTGDITLDPNASEPIDGLSSYVMYPGEVRLVQCDGAALTSIVLQTFVKVFPASATNTKPPGYKYFGGLAWGGGGGGGGAIGGGGGGGACVPFLLPEAAVPASSSVVIGAGGVMGAGGGNTTIFGIAAYGGGAGTAQGGGGGGSASAGVGPIGGLPRLASYANSNGFANPFGGADGAMYPAAGSWYGGGAGSQNGLGIAGSSQYGGGGGMGYLGTGAGASAFGGNGATNLVAATAPSGGGAYAINTSGARGEARVWGVM